MKVEVTAEDIREGQHKSTSRCPIALAIKRTTGAREVSVGQDSCRVDGASFKPSFMACVFMARFDRGNRVHPRVFDLEPDEAVR